MTLGVQRSHARSFAAVLLLCAVFVISAVPETFAARMQIPGGGGDYEVKSGRTFLDRRFRNVIRQQYDFSCGSAALATLLAFHYNMKLSEMDVLKAMYEQGDQEKIHREGFSLLDMKNYLSSIGMEAAGYREPLDKLAKVGIPAIVLINRKGYMHFVVVKGVTKDKVLIGDPTLGLRIYARKDFEPMWNGILFVVVNNMNTARKNFNTRAQWGAKQLILSNSLPDADLARYTLSISATPNYY